MILSSYQMKQSERMVQLKVDLKKPHPTLLQACLPVPGGIRDKRVKVLALKKTGDGNLTLKEKPVKTVKVRVHQVSPTFKTYSPVYVVFRCTLGKKHHNGANVLAGFDGSLQNTHVQIFSVKSRQTFLSPTKSWKITVLSSVSNYIFFQQTYPK